MDHGTPNVYLKVCPRQASVHLSQLFSNPDFLIVPLKLNYLEFLGCSQKVGEKASGRRISGRSSV